MTEREVLDRLRRRFSVRGGNGERYVLAEHVRDHGAWAKRTADLIVRDVWESAGSPLHGFEVKCSRQDWLTELKDPTKAERFRQFCDYWWLAVSDADIVRDDLPRGWGLLVPWRNSMKVKVPAIRQAPLPMERAVRVSFDRSIAKTARRHAVLDLESGQRQPCERYVNTSCIQLTRSTLCWACRLAVYVASKEATA